MTFRPYKNVVSDDALEAADGNLSDALERQMDETSRILDTYNIPNPANWEWNIKNRYWSKVWAEVKETENRHFKQGFTGSFHVVAGLNGSMEGIIVADGFSSCDDARRFAKDFETINLFCVLPVAATLWLKMVESAHKAKRMDSATLDSLRGKARENGIQNGRQLNREELHFLYKSGKTIDDICE